MTEAEKPAISGLLPHLRELRRRLKITGITYIVGVMVLMNFSALAFEIISEPLRAALPAGATLVFTNAPDVFFTYLKIALVLSLFITAPITFYQVWAFITPGLYKHEKAAFMRFFLSSVLLLFCGGFFAYYVVFPVIFQFLIGFSNEFIQPMIAIREHLTLVLKLLFAFGLSFEVPIIVVALVKLDLVSIQSLKDKRRYVFIWAFVVAAVLTPPDIISQTMLAIPIAILYEIGILVAGIGSNAASQQQENP